MGGTSIRFGTIFAGWIACVAAAPTWASIHHSDRDPLCVQPRGADVGTALLLEYFDSLPARREGMDSEAFAARMQAGLEKFKKRVKARYSEGTLQRLLEHPDSRTRRAAVLALSIIGTMASNEPLAGRLNDDDPEVREHAADALWSLWFRADSDENNQELQRLIHLRDADKAIDGLDALIRKAPGFAEAYNQRAILYFKQKEYDKCASDCEKTLQLNAQHFGAQSGLARCFMRLRKPRAALKAFRRAFIINPNLDGVEDAIRDLENALGEEGRTDDKK
jgi:tetratricopeptide (TPR) repeat protein